MFTIGDLKAGTIISHQGQPYVVVSANHIKTGRGGANLRTKIKNLVSGQNLEITYAGGDKIEEADLARSKASFLYCHNDDFAFMDSNSFEQFELKAEILGEQIGYLKEGLEVDTLIYNGRVVSVSLPAKIDLLVTEAVPGVKGDTAGTANKIVTLETGKQLRTPLFINKGDVIRVNTQTGEYVERA
jgi:elongation factor P